MINACSFDLFLAGMQQSSQLCVWRSRTCRSGIRFGLHASCHVAVLTAEFVLQQVMLTGTAHANAYSAAAHCHRHAVCRSKHLSTCLSVRVICLPVLLPECALLCKTHLQLQRHQCCTASGVQRQRGRVARILARACCCMTPLPRLRHRPHHMLL
jgi:hypothetical protein